MNNEPQPTVRESFTLVSSGVFRVLVLLIVGLADIALLCGLPVFWREERLAGIGKAALFAATINTIAYILWRVSTHVVRKTRDDIQNIS